MSEKNKIKIEKKLVASFALIIAIGIASIVPLTIFMGTAKAQTVTDDSWFNISLNHAYFSANIADGIYQSVDVRGFDTSFNMEAFNRQTGARIEYFEIICYTDDGIQLYRTTYYTGANSSYIENPYNFITLSRESWFDGDVYLDGSGGYYYDLPLAVSNIDSS